MKPSVIAARAGAVALIAAALSAALQRTDAGLYESVVALSLLAVAATSIWIDPATPPGRAISLAVSAPLLLLAAPGGAAGFVSPVALAVAAGPLFMVFASASLMRDRRAIVAALVGGVVAGPVRMLVYDPFLDPNCLGCGHAAIAVLPDPTTATQLRLVGLGIVLIAVVWELAHRSFGLIGLALCLAAFSLDLARQQALLAAGSYVVLVWARRSWLTWRRRSAVSRLLAAHDSGDGLTATLRRTIGDPTLLVGFPTYDGVEFVDAQGEPVHPAPGQSTTDLFVHGEVLARLHHSARTDVPDLYAALDSVAGLILQKERLTAQLAARVKELTRARTHVVRVGLEQRRTLERDLHDGVQQQLLAVGLDIRLALSSLPDDGTERDELEEALALVFDAVDRVREISTGVSPPMLATRGLSAAVSALVRRHGSAVEIGELPEQRLPPDVERAAYAVVAEGLVHGATAVRATTHGDELTVLAEGTVGDVDGVLPDLVEALGGKIRVGRSHIEAVIPCG